MVSVPVQCPYCHSTEVIKAGKQATGRNAIDVTTTGALGGSFFCSTKIAAGSPSSAARWSTWRSMAAASAIPPACCALAPRP